MDVDLGLYFKTEKENNCVRFVGDKLEIWLPDRYRSQRFLTVDDKVHVLGYFSMKINDKIECGICIPGIITIDTPDVSTVTINGEKYTYVVLGKNARFMDTLGIIEDNKTSIFMWDEFMAKGHIPPSVTYDTAATLFDNNKEFTGKDLGVDHAIYEIVVAHCYRDAKDRRIPYRLTAMRDKPGFLKLRDTTVGASTTHSRIVGSYAEQGITSAALNTSEDNHDLEDLFRA